MTKTDTATTLRTIAEQADARFTETIKSRTGGKRDRWTLTADDEATPEIYAALVEKIRADDVWISFLRWSSRAVAVLAVCLWSASASAQTPKHPAPKLLLSAYVAAMAADATTTYVALGRGARERVLFQNRYATDVILGAQTVAIVTATTRLARTHPKLARGLLLASTAIRVAVVARNVRVLRTQGRLQ